jgi:NAD(P)-dependent dehydrogenase (short-subunit alcohol dehydrogenase family)
MMPALCVPSVSTPPGAIALTRIFRGPNSAASPRVIAWSHRTADDIARVAVFLASDDSSWLTGERPAASGGLSAGAQAP